MFLMPGVLHCGGGAGPDIADWTAALADWVENGKAPDRVIASKLANGAVTRADRYARIRRRPSTAVPAASTMSAASSADDGGGIPWSTRLTMR